MLKQVAKNMEFTNKEAQFLSLIKKLSIDNYNTSKCSAAHLICEIFGVFSEEKKPEAFK